MNFGETRADVIISGKKSRVLQEVIVDTGATDTAIPAKMADELLIEIEARNVEADTMKGVTYIDQGNAFVEIEGRKRRVPIIIVREEIEPVIGLTTLEALGFKVNPVTRELEPVRPKLL